ncbi:MAG: hypothetical protein AAGG75_14200 [Bacteroidota bacterium]
MNKYTLFQSRRGLHWWLLFGGLTITSFPAFGRSVFVQYSDISCASQPPSIIIEDQWPRANNTTTIILYTHYFEQPLGYQLALSSPLDVISTREVAPVMLPAMTAENLGTSRLDKGLLFQFFESRQFSMNAPSFTHCRDTIPPQPEAPSFYLRLRSKCAQPLSQILHFVSSLAAEACLGAANSILLHALELHFGGSGLSAQRLLPKFTVNREAVFSEGEGALGRLEHKRD